MTGPIPRDPVPPQDDPLTIEIEALVSGDHADPFGVLGLHDAGSKGKLVLRCFLPEAQRVQVIETASGAIVGDLTRCHPAGLFAGPVDRDQRFAYRLRVATESGTTEIDDAYRFPPILGELDVHLLAEGTHLQSFERLGAHPMVFDGVAGTAFAVWAPNARRVSVVGDFCNWDGRRLPMRFRFECGVWELFVPGVGPGVPYKFEIKNHAGDLLPLKADPYAFQGESAPGTASLIHGLHHYDWQDQPWQAHCLATDWRSTAVSIYEVHLGSWRRHSDNSYLSYDELADQLVPYAKDMGFTHIELLPVTEHPFDGSWGYQPIGLFAPTSRHGTPDQFQRFVERCHDAGIGLLLDWVPGHFPTDAHGLAWFDGTHLYEHADPRQGFHRDWNTLIYNFGRHEVTDFLLTNGLFWLQHYHLDGLRVDAVASMLYLDYSRKPGEWIPNQYGGNENLEAVAFLKRVNELAYRDHPGTLTIAEESTAWPGVSRPTWLGGLGFGFKWNMGWMHDTLNYISKEPIHRRYHHNDLTFGLLYAFSENFILPLSHDEVVHGKKSLIGKMPGDRWQQFANLRAYYGFMFGHPGKKLLFMGGEFAQRDEWSHDHSLSWSQLDENEHRGVQSLVRDLNHLYQALPALHQQDCEQAGFEWIDALDSDNSVLAFLRYAKDRDDPVVVVCNFTPVPRDHYRIGVPFPGRYRVRLDTDAPLYGGSGYCGDANRDVLADETIAWHGRPCSLDLRLPPLGTLLLQRQG
ncbi:MAG: 1,4-alpha-glucan branching protein GlgB [Azospirillaceae bacterium]|nr:1,4-alpha-glucan branching protein GlgB [Azospirillaceae bacterium]